MANAERISPFNRGSNHCFLCASLPYFASTSILPVSGALQLKISELNSTRPISSHSGAYSALVNPAPYGLYSSGKNKFHSPASFAFCLSVCIMSGVFQRPSPDAHSTAWMYSCSTGYTSSSIKALSFSKSACVFSLYSKFITAPFSCR